MTVDRDQRTYDILRLIADHEPVGSVHLTEFLRQRGYSITERTVRLTLAELDEAALTEKAGGKGRRLTDAGRGELERGGVVGRVEQLSERLADLKSGVTYDPDDDAGDVVVGTVTVANGQRDRLEELLQRIDASPIGPVVASVDPAPDREDAVEVAVPSSVTVDGVLLGNGIDSHPDTIGIVEYHPGPASVPYDDPAPEDNGGVIRRFTDVIGDERATLDLGSLLVEAGRTDVASALTGGTGLLVADNREFPLTHYDEGEALAEGVRGRLGGVLDLRRPREPGPFPWGAPGWSFASLTYVGTSETVISRCVEAGIARDWETLAGIRSRSAFEPVSGT